MLYIAGPCLILLIAICECVFYADCLPLQRHAILSTVCAATTKIQQMLSTGQDRREVPQVLELDPVLITPFKPTKVRRSRINIINITTYFYATKNYSIAMKVLPCIVHFCSKYCLVYIISRSSPWKLLSNYLSPSEI